LRGKILFLVCTLCANLNGTPKIPAPLWLRWVEPCIRIIGSKIELPIPEKERVTAAYIFANSRFPQVSVAVVFHLVAFYLNEQVSAKSLIEFSDDQIETIALAMSDRHSSYGILYPYVGKNENSNPDAITFDDVQGLVTGLAKHTIDTIATLADQMAPGGKQINSRPQLPIEQVAEKLDQKVVRSNILRTKFRKFGTRLKVHLESDVISRMSQEYRQEINQGLLKTVHLTRRERRNHLGKIVDDHSTLFELQLREMFKTRTSDIFGWAGSSQMVTEVFIRLRPFNL